jgi:hypothetical protein
LVKRKPSSTTSSPKEPLNSVSRYVYQRERVYTPIASARSVLLDLLGIHVGMAALGKETREMLRGKSSAFGEALVVTVIGLVGASHCRGEWSARGQRIRERKGIPTNEEGECGRCERVRW